MTKTTATFAEGPGSQPNYIFPLASLAYFSVSNLSQFQYLMYRPLYWFGDNGQVQLNTEPQPRRCPRVFLGRQVGDHHPQGMEVVGRPADHRP